MEGEDMAAVAMDMERAKPDIGFMAAVELVQLP